MNAVVDGPDVAGLVDANAVRIAEHPLAPRPQILARRIEHDDWIGLRTTLERIDIALNVCRDGRCPTEFETVGHRVGFFAEPDLDAVFEQAALVRRPAVGHVSLVGRLSSRL